ncbi:MAG: SusC/RagA family TonB-linked outer membrane protein [Prevotellaceae bacterium]|nr:SusC/RagA family TonB-linked outer membrane protein [Prevotellaceae bacterium]
MLCLTASIDIALSQNRTITGTVVSAEDNEPVIGATVVIDGTTTGGVSDMNGKFTVAVPPEGKTMTVSYVGMLSQTMPVKNGLRVVLKMDTRKLDEVVVTAMGLTREKRSLGYSLQEVGSEELTKVGQLSVTGALSGKLAGVQINQFGGSVGASSRISIRGNSSLQADQQPLIVVDGVPIANDTQRTGNNTYVGVDYGSGINDINPEDIESVTVLKGGSAALYGMRAGNGVILITTKSGKNTKDGFKVSYDGSITFDRVANLPKLQNSYGQGYNGDEYHWKLYHPELSYQDYAERYSFSFVDGKDGGINDGFDESWGPRLDAGLQLVQYDSNGQKAPWVSHPNNVKDFFQTGISHTHTVSIAADSERFSTRASLSYRGQTGTVPNTDQKRYSAALNTSMKVNRTVTMDMSANYTRTQSDNLVGQGYGGNNPINGLLNWSARQMNMKTLKANWDQKDANGDYTYYNWNTQYALNPYFNVYENTNSYQRDRFFGKASLYYQPFECLKFEGRAGLDYYNAQSFERHYHDNSDYPNGGFQQYDERNTELNLDFIASFNKTFGDWNITAMAGANYRDRAWQGTTLGADNLTVPGEYTVGNVHGVPVTSMSHSHLRSNSVYANLSLGWKNQLYLDASARNDWSSTINDSFFYPSVSLSWIATESIPYFRENKDVLSFLKLRAGWAEIGSATSAYRNRAYYYPSDAAFGGTSLIYKSTVYPNPDLKPEKVRSWEIGAEFGFVENRIHLDWTYYKKNTSNEILTVTLPYSSGYAGKLLNAGKIQNKGVEIQLGAEILKSKKGLNWNSTLNFSKDNSKVIELYPQMGLNTYQIGWTWGVATMAVAGEKWGDIVGTATARVTEDDVKAGTATKDQLGAIKIGSNGLMKTVSGAKMGNVTPDFLLNWRHDFSIKNFGFGFLLDMRVGGDIWSQTMDHSYYAGTSVVTAKDGIRERAIVVGKDIVKNKACVMKDAGGAWVTNTIETDAQFYYENNPSLEEYVFKGSFLKLREVYISYTLPKRVMAKTKYISGATVALTGTNLALLWVDKSNTMRMDPETGGVASDSSGVGFEQSAVPGSRSFGLKVNLQF